MSDVYAIIVLYYIYAYEGEVNCSLSKQGYHNQTKEVSTQKRYLTFCSPWHSDARILGYVQGNLLQGRCLLLKLFHNYR
jgi:hypothetical protein